MMIMALNDQLEKVGTFSVKSFEELENIIQRGSKAFLEVGNALREIQGKRLSKLKELGYKNFEDYCDRRWGFKRDYAYKMIRSADIKEKLESSELYTNCIQKSPEREGQYRELSRLPDAHIAPAWQEFCDSGEKLTQKNLRSSVKNYMDREGLLPVNSRTGNQPEHSPIIKPSDNWNFATVAFPRLPVDGDGDEEWGYVPGDLYANCLWYWTKDGDRVVAPMAGSGQIIRVWEQRHQWQKPDKWDIDLHCFDLNPRGLYRDKIGENDLTDGLPIDGVDYIVMDIPYFGMVSGQYSSSHRDIANAESPVEWIESIQKVSKSCWDALRENALCTVITPNYREVKDGMIFIAADFVLNAFVSSGFALHDKAYSTRRIQQSQTPGMARMNKMAKTRKVMLSDMAEVLTLRKING